MQRRGFTIVELLIAITIMGILLVISVVALSSSQRNARDDERKADVQAIASSLEDYYNGNNPTGSTGRYPATNITGSEANVKSALRDAVMASYIAPGAEGVAQSFVPATNSTQTIDGVTPLPAVNTYVYQPLLANGSLCAAANEECRKFNLYYRPENGAVVKITSRRQ